MKIKSFISIFLLLAAAGLLLLPAESSNFRENAPVSRDNQIREPDLMIYDGVCIPGFWRPAYRNGFIWIEAETDEAGRWHSGYWRPLKAERQVEEEELITYWGPQRRPGYVWIKIAEGPDAYPRGRWEPFNEYRSSAQRTVWVPGYWSGRKWISGYWRPKSRDGYHWVSGYYGRDGIWREAHWKEGEPVTAVPPPAPAPTP